MKQQIRTDKGPRNYQGRYPGIPFREAVENAVLAHRLTPARSSPFESAVVDQRSALLLNGAPCTAGSIGTATFGTTSTDNLGFSVAEVRMIHATQAQPEEQA